ncbi:hypothetical protein KI659_03715 [Litoribacter alkaliphilus]|uniref:Uncharacterized protein n=1 Tax=Litoribacter ruber TaxID=702568 RepID=A0AAP2G0X6_9BACT|nr:hypothetical protein [Litoribacter alkaliphilus]MBS9523117.1 hypothetical protein [Litoribacter alkaliphilus]
MIDINISGLITSLILMVVFALPIVYYAIKAGKKRKATKSLLRHYAAGKGLNLDELDTWRFTYGIGLDNSASQLIYMEKDGNPEVITIDLEQVERVDVQVSKLKSSQNGGSSIITDLQLSFIPNMPGKTPINLTFFSSEKFISLQNEFELVNKWKQKVEGILAQREKSEMEV